jgi:endogenous inhibitor of DNA gyrase (YacG/DUF329 family)
MPRCPVCDAPIDLQTTPTVPFCSDRCRLVDLGRWLDESYGVPAPPPGDDEEEAEGRGPDEHG